MKSSLLVLITFFFSQTVFAQLTNNDPVLMTINGKEITRSEFEYIYNKNKSLAGVEQKTLDEYVDLFVNFKLKVQSAEDAGIDTLSSFREELDGYRQQLLTSLKENPNTDFDSNDFKLLMQEYRDGMLLFEVSSRKIWDHAASDGLSLQLFFQDNRNNYEKQQTCYKGIVLNCADKKTASKAKKLLKKQPMDKWEQTIIQAFDSAGKQKIKFEYGLFKENDHPYVDKVIYKKGNYIPDEEYPVTTLLGEKIMTEVTYEDVLGQLTLDYQNYLDSVWIARLRSVSKIEINEEILKTVNNR